MNHNTDRFAWIDFDYEVSHTDYDLWSMGNLLIRIIGKGAHKLRDIERWLVRVLKARVARHLPYG